jgi:polyferredoxin
MDYERGLVRYTTLNQLDGQKWTWKRPKLIGYAIAVTIMLSAVSYMLLSRVPLELDVLRSRGQLYQEVPGGLIQNIYTLKVINMDKSAYDYDLTVSGLPEYRIVPSGPISVPAGEIGELSVNLLVNPELLTQVNTPIVFEVQTTDGKYSAVSKSTYIGPVPVK